MRGFIFLLAEERGDVETPTQKAVRTNADPRCFDTQNTILTGLFVRGKKVVDCFDE